MVWVASKTVALDEMILDEMITDDDMAYETSIPQDEGPRT